MTITTMAQLQSALPGRYSSWFPNVAPLSSTPPSWTDLFQSRTGFAIPPTAGEIPNNGTAGAWPIAGPAAGHTLYIARLRAWAGTNTTYPVVLADRLVHSSGLNATLTTAQTVTAPAVNRPDATGNDARLYLEIYTAIGATATTATVSYTNQSGVAGQTATAPLGAVGNSAAQTMIPVHLATGDTGVQSVQSVTLAATTGTAGNFGITIARQLAWVAPGVNLMPVSQDHFELGLPYISQLACLFFMFQENSYFKGAELITVEG